MVKYKKLPKKPNRLKLPVWKNESFPRLAGMMDSLMHKAQITHTAQEQELLHSGRVVRVQRRFHEYESAMREYLLHVLLPLEEETRQLLVTCNQTVPENFQLHAHTSANLRAARAAAAQRQQLLEQIQESRVQLAQLVRKLQYKCEVAESQLQQAFFCANAELARYAKATVFAVVEKEIPTLTRSFYPEQLLDKQLLLQANSVTTEV
ncbi:hypothetical protein [Gemmiger sp. An50]|uniref:hypothetical protein n=1 Tax=Gemmiger sp. An50 TaxID=1965639 RepID=UPI000B38DE21|nr:hypothetical protein [Gemmiger sp. An50]OUN83766.1 hypothetical protein B5G03_14230 [Gemmiger sp. An50]